MEYKIYKRFTVFPKSCTSWGPWWFVCTGCSHQRWSLLHRAHLRLEGATEYRSIFPMKDWKDEVWTMNETLICQNEPYRGRFHLSCQSKNHRLCRKMPSFHWKYTENHRSNAAFERKDTPSWWNHRLYPPFVIHQSELSLQLCKILQKNHRKTSFP